MHESARLPISSAVLAAGIAFSAIAGVSLAADRPPSVLVITVDTLRTDRMSGYGHDRPTSPRVDDLMSRGARFTSARTIEPLTNPALSSMLTGLLPHEHAASRNGLRIEEGLDSLPKILARNGWRTAAVVANWTLKDNISGLGEHFEDYVEVFTRRRWFGVVNARRPAADVTDEAVEWLGRHLDERAHLPFLLWVHYVEPHAPYVFHEEFAQRLGIEGRDPPRSDRYDTEIADVDHQIGRLLDQVERRIEGDRVIIVFTADHGESLGEHNEWGHGRDLYEPGLRIPMSFTWQGTVEQQVVESSAHIIDIPSTVLDLLDLAVPPSFRGVSWAAALRGRRPAGRARRLLSGPPRRGARRQRVGPRAIQGPARGRHHRPAGARRCSTSTPTCGSSSISLRILASCTTLVAPSSTPSPELIRCVGDISDGLGSLDRLTTKKLDKETVEQLRALGYLE